MDVCTEPELPKSEILQLSSAEVPGPMEIEASQEGTVEPKETGGVAIQGQNVFSLGKQCGNKV